MEKDLPRWPLSMGMREWTPLPLKEWMSIAIWWKDKITQLSWVVRNGHAEVMKMPLEQVDI